eukprot:TRINITY_DN5692_c0_g1_i1.p1 TRINITY_DN5692_c0_g1~~TRINITY_DN5692_c0_g1_i1.p1  ORF type:complete len:202 (-),score=29.29 TRINITY_DN5692_c0_g1_i1:44-649(-)
MSYFSNVDYWNDRYTNYPDCFDWYVGSQMKPLLLKIKEFCPLESIVLMVGCGNSALSEQMVLEGYQKVFNIDFSPVVIDLMNERFNNSPRLVFEVMNVLELGYQDEFFDVIVDKATLDSIMCSNKSFKKVNMMIRQIYRVLKPGGIYISISHASPEDRLELFRTESANFQVEVVQLEKEYATICPSYGTLPQYFMYIASKV